MKTLPLSSLLARWELEFERGRDVPAAELCRDCPEWVANLEHCIAALRWVKEQAQSAGPGTPAAGSGQGQEELDPPAAPWPSTLADSPPAPVAPPAFLQEGRETPSPAAGPQTTGSQAPPDRLADGGTVPGYQIVGELGRGGMGVVYRAVHEELHRPVALKMILAGSHAGADERARFRDEAKAVAALGHPGIVQVYEIGTHNDLPYFALEFCPGGSLADRLDGTPRPPREAAELVARLADAVAYAHQRGVVHRDLKPANVLLAEDGTPRSPTSASPSASETVAA
jgi:hypothetical protein